jgi:hypothetical protein
LGWVISECFIIGGASVDALAGGLSLELARGWRMRCRIRTRDELVDAELDAGDGKLWI